LGTRSTDVPVDQRERVPDRQPLRRARSVMLTLPRSAKLNAGRLDHDRRARLDLLATHPLSLLHPRG
jgi:hypothetical protein